MADARFTGRVNAQAGSPQLRTRQLTPHQSYTSGLMGQAARNPRLMKQAVNIGQKVGRVVGGYRKP